MIKIIRKIYKFLIKFNISYVNKLIVYDNLVSFIGGPETPAAGFGSGIERIMLSINDNSLDI